MILDMQTVRNLQGLGHLQLIPAQQVDQANFDVRSWTERKMFEELQTTAMIKYGVAIRREEVVYSDWAEGPFPDALVCEAHWDPQTDWIELSGGTLDGMVTQVDYVHLPLTMRRTVLVPDSETGGEVIDSVVEQPYARSGWNTSTQRWVFSPLENERPTPDERSILLQ